MGRFSIILFCICFVIFSCNDEKKKTAPPIEEKKIIQKFISYKTDKLLITDYAKGEAYGDTAWINSKYADTYETTDLSVINKFEQLLKNTKNNKYCCCPGRNYIISFFDNNENYKSYVVEILKGKDSVLIYDFSFQFSSKISIKDWKGLLGRSEKLISNYYYLCNLTNARNLYKYAKENKLTVAYNNTDSKNWVSYDGDFKFTVSRVGKKLTEEEIISRLNKAYPNLKYKTEFSNFYELCGSSDPKVDDCNTEYTVTISCNKDFYNKFSLYQPKSVYNEFCPDFLILGNINNLKGTDKIATKEKDRID